MRAERINFLASITAAAGLVGFIGVFADWFRLVYGISGTTVVLDLDGTTDVTGALAVIGGLGALAFGSAYLLLRDPQIRRLTAILMALFSILLWVTAMVGFTRVGEAIGEPRPFLPGAEGETVYVATISVGLVVSVLAGIVATVASVLLVGRREAGLETDDEIST